MQPFSLVTVILASTSLVAGHGQVTRVTSGGSSNSGPNQYYAADAKNSKTATRVMYKASGPSYVLQMSCESSAKSPAPKTISVAAGDEIDVYWEGATSELKGKAGTGQLTSYNPWVHAMGFVMDYITSCDGDCTKFDATNAGWTKIAHAGLDMSNTISKYFPTSSAGLWAMAKLVQNGSKWSIKIPSSLKSGQYMIRHELSAVHNPKTSDPTTGPQLYIACIQLDVTSGGDTSLPRGTQANALYEPSGAFANIDVYSDSFNPANVAIPGPAIWDGVSSSKRDTSGKTVTMITNSSASTTTLKRACKERRDVMKRAHNLPLRSTHRNRLN
ncbi:glycosyl hydrolase family 61-domain-containing protein [Mycena sp. CBHHK59/15]|nr:glycosyl hydrolase family 61-domain-containing protein [Mycena sp. CBHHK59/15]